LLETAAMKDRVIAEFPVKAGKRDEFEAALRAALPDTRGFKGCRGIKVFHDAQRDTFVLIEKWKSCEHYDAYLAWRMETGLAEMLEPLLKGGAKGLKITKLKATDI
jgi:quinol monooxygenase YgiN